MTEEFDNENQDLDAPAESTGDTTDAKPVDTDTPSEGAIDEGGAQSVESDDQTGTKDDEPEHRERRKDESKAKAPKPEAGAGYKPQRSATKTGKGKSGHKRTYNPGKTPPKPIELKDHSPWYIPWIGTTLIVVSLILIILNYILQGLPPLNNWWIPIGFIGMTAGLVVLSRWK